MTPCSVRCAAAPTAASPICTSGSASASMLSLHSSGAMRSGSSSTAPSHLPALSSLVRSGAAHGSTSWSSCKSSQVKGRHTTPGVHHGNGACAMGAAGEAGLQGSGQLVLVAARVRSTASHPLACRATPRRAVLCCACLDALIHRSACAPLRPAPHCPAPAPPRPAPHCLLASPRADPAAPVPPHAGCLPHAPSRPHLPDQSAGKQACMHGQVRSQACAGRRRAAQRRSRHASQRTCAPVRQHS